MQNIGAALAAPAAPTPTDHVFSRLKFRFRQLFYLQFRKLYFI